VARVPEILPDEDRRRSMGEARRAFAPASFLVEVMVQRINAVYCGLSQERLPGRLPLPDPATAAGPADLPGPRGR
jgi:hypothetical protein